MKSKKEPSGKKCFSSSAIIQKPAKICKCGHGITAHCKRSHPISHEIFRLQCRHCDCLGFIKKGEQSENAHENSHSRTGLIQTKKPKEFTASENCSPKVWIGEDIYYKVNEDDAEYGINRNLFRKEKFISLADHERIIKWWEANLENQKQYDKIVLEQQIKQIFEDMEKLCEIGGFYSTEFDELKSKYLKENPK